MYCIRIEIFHSLQFIQCIFIFDSLFYFIATNKSSFVSLTFPALQLFYALQLLKYSSFLVCPWNRKPESTRSERESPPSIHLDASPFNIIYRWPVNPKLLQTRFEARRSRRKSRRKAHTEGGRPYIKGRLWPLLSLFMKAVSGQAPGAGGFGIKSRNSIS